MGRPAGHFGHDPQAAGQRAAEEVAAGRMTTDELKERYKEAKDMGYGEEFQAGYAEGAHNH